MSTPFTPGQPTSAKKSKPSSGGPLANLFGAGKTWIGLAVVVALGAALVSFSILGRSAERSTYYVLNQDIPARTMITPSMMAPVTTAAGSEPVNALTPASIAATPTFARIPLALGDVVTPTNAGPLERIDANLPAGYVVTSFSAPAERAVAGKVRAGDYVDIIAVGGAAGSDQARVILHRVLVLDVTTDPSTIAKSATSSSVTVDGTKQPPSAANAPGPESSQVRGGIPELYVVALSPTDAARLALASSSDLFVVLSSNDAEGTDVDVSVGVEDLFGAGAVGDASAGLTATPTPAATDGALPGVTVDPAAGASASPTAPATPTPAATR